MNLKNDHFGHLITLEFVYFLLVIGLPIILLLNIPKSFEFGESTYLWYFGLFIWLLLIIIPIFSATWDFVNKLDFQAMRKEKDEKKMYYLLFDEKDEKKIKKGFINIQNRRKMGKFLKLIDDVWRELWQKKEILENQSSPSKKYKLKVVDAKINRVEHIKNYLFDLTDKMNADEMKMLKELQTKSHLKEESKFKFDNKCMKVLKTLYNLTNGEFNNLIDRDKLEYELKDMADSYGTIDYLIQTGFLTVNNPVINTIIFTSKGFDEVLKGFPNLKKIYIEKSETPRLRHIPNISPEQMGHIIKPLSSNKNEIDKNVYKTKLSTFEKIGIMVGMMSLCGMIGGVLGGFLLEILENNLRILTGTLIGVGFGFVIGSIIILKYS